MEPESYDRPAARLLVLDGAGRLLLFRFAYTTGPLAGSVYWAPPGGGLEAGETFEAAACREMREETGLEMSHPGPVVARRHVAFMMPDGRTVRSEERYFLMRVATLEITSAGWSQAERDALVAYDWWTQDALARVREQIWPDDMGRMLVEAGAWPDTG